ncbi:hypothetical protein NW768_010256 [Fusarium equiseti]|uniref:Uncharacterized protein n=1 Tax=Fusarium equiseti TaxID=61235 RepID=A0ABQ8R0U6_FUSEQ|nr:hypothetical protein NW768_010256 [Fusarium equiseti]
MMRQDEDQDTEGQREHVTRTNPAETKDIEQNPAEQDSSADDGVLSEKYPLCDLEKGLIGWDSQDDPANPR